MWTEIPHTKGMAVQLKHPMDKDTDPPWATVYPSTFYTDRVMSGWRYFSPSYTDYTLWPTKEEAMKQAERNVSGWLGAEYRIGPLLLASWHRSERDRRSGRQFYFLLHSGLRQESYRTYFQFPVEAMKAAELEVAEQLDDCLSRSTR